VRGNLLGLEDKFETFQWWVIEGGYSADEPELYASFRHFYDPRAKEMGRPPYLTDHLDELGWYFKVVASVGGWAGPMLNEIGQNPEVDARDWAINGSENRGWGENEYSWKKGVEYMRQAFESTDAVEKSKYFAQAWRALGETMHLSADMTVPAHVRNDSHPAFNINWSALPVELRNPDPNVGFLKGDAYETWAQDSMINQLGGASVEPEMQGYINQSTDALDLFDRVALFTNTSFFSAETVSGIDPATGDAVHSANGMPDYPSPSLKKTQYDRKTGNYTKTIGSKVVCLAHRSWLSEIGWGSADPRITRRCVESQAEVLVPVAVASNAKLLEWFIPRVKVEITEVDTDNNTLRGSFVHEPYGAYSTKMNFSTAADASNPFYLNGSRQHWDDYKLEVKNGDITLTYGDKVARNIEDARADGKAVVSLAIDMGGIEVRSNDFPLTKTPTPTPTSTPKVTPTETAATGQWVLKYIDIDVDKLEDPFSFPGLACSGGPKVASTETGATTTTTGTCQIRGAQVANATTKHSWSRPPERLVPGQEVSGTVTASGSGVCSWTDLTTEESCNRSTSTRLIVLLADSLREEPFRGADTVYNSAGRTLGVPGAGEAANAKDRPTSSFAWKVPDRRGGNKSLLVKFSVGVGSCCGNGAGSVATIFWYEWVATGGSAAATPRVITPAATPTATPETTPTATPEATPTATPEATPAATSEATPAATPEATPAATPSVTEEEFFRVASLGGANNGATKPTTFSINKSWLVTKITTYHWNNGQGKTPGTVGLRAADGTTYGPWQATGEPGSGGVPNAYWVVRPNIVIPPGTYTVLDSDPSTWAQNEETGGAGMSWGSGIRQENP
jgi:hypothetical protein